MELPTKRKRRRGEQSTEQNIYITLREVQLISGCTTRTLNVMLQKLKPFLKGCEHVKNLQMPRMRSRRKSQFKMQLHGCVRADCEYVFGPENTATHCPECGDSRYSLDGKPQEVSLSHTHTIFFFVLTYCVMYAGVLVLPYQGTNKGTT